jgi:hypothetical protein
VNGKRSRVRLVLRFDAALFGVQRHDKMTNIGVTRVSRTVE